MKTILSILFFFTLNVSIGQRIDNEELVWTLTDYDRISKDGYIQVEVDVRMADVVSYVELNDVWVEKDDKKIWDKISDWWWFKVLKRPNYYVNRSFTKTISIENYFLVTGNDNNEKIVLRTKLIPLRSLFGNKEKINVQFIIHRKGDNNVIYSENLIFKRSYFYKHIYINFR